MRNMKNWFLVTFFFLSISSVFAQGKISGTVQDKSGPLPGANVVIEGTTTSASTGFDGSFTLNSSKATGKLVISYLGYETQKVEYSIVGSSSDLGVIVLKDESNQLGEVVIKSTVIDVAKDRKTPVAVSTIKAAEIREKLGNQEFPEMLNTTPSVYATKAGGGFGDSRINIRGFSQENIAVMVNGVPVNDMENGRVFWSNWAGISDVTSAMQVQRGLGSSKLAISSVGGTINIITKSSDKAEGGMVSSQIANNNSYKLLATYSTGKMKNGLSASVLYSRSEGSTYADATAYQASNYFIGLGYELNEKHDFQFTFTGAPQWHNQRFTSSTIADYIKYGDGKEPNTKYNADWGYLNGRVFNTSTNFYHKPVMSLNWDWKINETTKLSSVVYGSWGRGAGAATNVGRIRGLAATNAAFRLPDGTLDVQKIYNWNSGLPVVINGVTQTRQKVDGYYQNDASASSTPNNFSGISKVNSFNSHDWYGGVFNLNKKIGENITVDLGLDGRYYHGIHFQSVNNLLGAEAYNGNYTPATASAGSNNDINGTTAGPVFGEYEARPSWNPFKSYDYQNKINYNNDGFVRWYGAFTQVEYSKDNLTAFVQGAISQQGFQRADYFKYLTTDPLYKTDYENILGGNVKGGINYNLTEQMNVFVNSGYYSKQPNFRAVYPNNQSVVNEDLTNEKVFGVEAGYGFRSPKFNANINVYHTTWKDRYDRRTITSGSNAGGYVELPGIQEVHDGVELDFFYAPINAVKINGMFSYGNWYYKGNATANEFNASNGLVSTSPLYLDDVKVGDAAQMTASLGATVEPVKNLKFDANYRLVDKLYASIDTRSFSAQNNKGSLELPSYGLLDAGMSFKINRNKDAKEYFGFRLNVNNVLDEIYISESRTNIFADDYVNPSNPAAGTYASNNRLYNGVANANQVYFGFGRTWNFTFSYNF
ncbi:TonB-dependent receptor [Flavobacterium amniphilum]|uniref:TonB-dependent receptor n=1 Tax=Flavobacterium amniphilum TaxID=1834035 RepID=UPI00202A4ABC|nr:TonB-dependent receptor [Flavobacterium amniphilum]MCL9805981.1 TonB-dependent receptor [Flavobacterium amniphilum]